MPVDLLIEFAQNFAENGYSHERIKEVFSVNREVRLADIKPSNNVLYSMDALNETQLKVAEEYMLDGIK